MGGKKSKLDARGKHRVGAKVGSGHATPKNPPGAAVRELAGGSRLCGVGAGCGRSCSTGRRSPALLTCLGFPIERCHGRGCLVPTLVRAQHRGDTPPRGPLCPQPQHPPCTVHEARGKGCSNPHPLPTSSLPVPWPPRGGGAGVGGTPQLHQAMSSVPKASTSLDGASGCPARTRDLTG